jgi:hypothetical protein
MKLAPIIALAFIALVLAAPAAAGEITRTADTTAHTWTSTRTFASDAMVCTHVWIRGRLASAISSSITSTTYYRAGIVVRLGFRRLRAPVTVRYVSFTRPGTVRVRWEIVRRAADC